MESPAAPPVRRGMKEVHESKEVLGSNAKYHPFELDAFIISSLIKRRAPWHRCCSRLIVQRGNKLLRCKLIRRLG